MCQPDIHIFTASQAKFVTLPKDGEVVNGKVVRVVDEYYKRSEVWKPEMVKRWEDARKVDKNVEEVVGGLGRVKI